MPFVREFCYPKLRSSLKFAITFEDNHVALSPLALCDIFSLRLIRRSRLLGECNSAPVPQKKYNNGRCEGVERPVTHLSVAQIDLMRAPKLLDRYRVIRSADAAEIEHTILRTYGAGQFNVVGRSSLCGFTPIIGKLPASHCPMAATTEPNSKSVIPAFAIIGNTLRFPEAPTCASAGANRNYRHHHRAWCPPANR